METVSELAGRTLFVEVPEEDEILIVLCCEHLRVQLTSLHDVRVARVVDYLLYLQVLVLLQVVL